MIELNGLTKQFGSFTALYPLDLKIRDGAFFGLLGPNGAGKTTTIRLMTTLLLPTEGEIRIDGERLTRDRVDLKKKISVVPQEFSMQYEMTLPEVMEYQGRLYHLPRSERVEKTRELLEFGELWEHRKKTVHDLSGGMKRKLMICRALLTNPSILLLDEPTVGMDTISRRQMWELLHRLNAQNLTIVLTTHYIEEAQMLCNEIALLNGGKLDDVDTPANMILKLGAYAVDFKEGERMESRYFQEREEAIRALEKTNRDASLRDTTLEDVFVARVGKKLTE